MKTRIISAAVAIVLLLAILLCPYTVVFAVSMAILAAIAVWELLHNTCRVKSVALTVVSMAFAVLEVMAAYLWMRMRWSMMPTIWSAVPSGQMLTQFIPLILLLLFVLYVALFLLKNHADTDVMTGGWAVFSALYAAAGFASLAALRANPSGLYLIVLTFVIPWMSDTGAYFVGTFLGKHKMTPVISPKKSWEGFFGGWAVSVGSAVLSGVIYQKVADVTVSLWLLGILAFVLVPLSVAGDLFASVIKRQSSIKDYGNVMPGHGGVMDRFDSVLIIAPLVLAVFHCVPLLV